MKRFSFASLVIVVVLFFSLAFNSVAVQAYVPDSESGGWTSGTEVEIDLAANPAPAWLQLFGKGVVISAPQKICHEFRIGQYDWIADIRQWVGGEWKKVPTTQGWVPSEEGTYMACAQAPAAGKYAMFGYYVGAPKASAPTPPPLSPVCSTLPFTMAGYTVYYVGEGYDYQYDFDFVIDFDTLPQTFTFTILSHNPPDSELWQPYTTQTIYFWSFFKFVAQSDDPDIDPITVRVETDTCHFDLTLSKIVD